MTLHQLLASMDDDTKRHRRFEVFDSKTFRVVDPDLNMRRRVKSSKVIRQDDLLGGDTVELLAVTI